MDKRLLGSATRYIAGRHAVQTVYWRKSANQGNGLVKTTKTCSFDKKGHNSEMFARIRDRYSV